MFRQLPPTIQGLAGVTLSAGVPALHGEQAAINQSAFFIAALYIVAIGTGAALQLRQEGCVCLPRKMTAVLTMEGLHEASQFTARVSRHGAIHANHKCC